MGELYEEILALIRDRRRIPDSLFQEHTYAVQASGDDWGRGYQPDPGLVDAGGSLVEQAGAPEPSREAHVRIDRVATRQQAITALEAISAQGEGPDSLDSDKELSHFDRFVEIYEAFAAHQEEGLNPSRPVAVNPTTLWDPARPTSYISAKHSREWASLFNLRYRMLLRYLAHTFRLTRTNRSDTPNLRAMVMHRVFGEMYNLKTIAGILMRLPMHQDEASGFAGPPFELPYTLHLAGAELEVWINYRDLIGSSQRICMTLIKSGAADQVYLQALLDLDSQARAWTERIIAGLRSTERPFE